MLSLLDDDSSCFLPDPTVIASNKYESELRQTFPFMELPGELRNKIYRYAVVHEGPLVVPMRYCYHEHDPPLACLSKTTRTWSSTSYCQIWGACPQVQPMSCERDSGDIGCINTALLRVSRQIYEEAINFLYPGNMVAVFIEVADRFPNGVFSAQQEFVCRCLVPEFSNFGRLGKLRIDFHTDGIHLWDRVEETCEKGYLLVHALQHTPTIRSIQIVLHLDKVVYDRASGACLSTSLNEQLRYVYKSLWELKDLLNLETIEVVIGSWWPAEWLASPSLMDHFLRRMRLLTPENATIRFMVDKSQSTCFAW